MRDRASGFCVFNDCGIAVEHLRKNYNIQRVAYIDIDAHHGDGMYYPFQDDPNLIFADVHQDGRTIYPGTGDRSEIGTGQAKGTKLNIPLPVGANDGHFQHAWTEIQNHWYFSDYWLKRYCFYLVFLLLRSYLKRIMMKE